MKILAYGDIHVHNFQEFSSLNDQGYSTRVELALQSLRYVLDYAVDNMIEYVINLGDLVEHSKTVNTVIGSLIAEVLGDPKYADLKHYFIVGNHDQVDAAQVYNVANFYKKYFTDIISCPDFVGDRYSRLYTGFQLGGYNILFLPYTEDYPPFINLIHSIPTEERKKTLVFGHWSIDGVRYSEDYPAKAEITQSYFEHFKLVTMGHIHLRQRLRENIVYPGSLLAHSFKDAEGPKGFMVFNTETGTYKLHDNPLSPNFHTIDVTSEESIRALKTSSSDFYRLLIPYDEVYRYKDILEGLNNVSVHPLQNKQEAAVRLEDASTFEESAILKTYTDLQNIRSSKTTASYGNKLLKRVVQ